LQKILKPQIARYVCVPEKGTIGMWIELGIFVIVLAFGIWQIHDVGLERRKKQDMKKTTETMSDGDHEE